MQIGGAMGRPGGAISRGSMTRGAAKRPTGTLKMKASSKLAGPKKMGPTTGPASAPGGPNPTAGAY